MGSAQHPSLPSLVSPHNYNTKDVQMDMYAWADENKGTLWDFTAIRSSCGDNKLGLHFLDSPEQERPQINYPDYWPVPCNCHDIL